MTLRSDRCSACDEASVEVFYETDAVPVHSVLLMTTRERARAYPRGEIRLGFCRRCGMVTNTAFDPSLLEYSAAYEETQGFSPTFNEFQRRLIEDLIERHNLHGKRVLEIGCGKGEFLTLLCDLGGNRGVGYDPSYVSDRGATSPNVEFIAALYDQASRTDDVDFVCCRMTLEHIRPAASFMSTLRRTIGPKTNAKVFVQVPDFERILQQCAFWDIYYEHCSYFTRVSLGGLFERSGFAVTNEWTDYDGQYLMMEASPGRVPAESERAGAIAELARRIDRLSNECTVSVRRWTDRLDEARRRGCRVALWGAGSKAVAFLAAVDRREVVECAVDINPHKQGTYLPGGGQKIVAPEFLREYRPGLVIAMNPVYRDEIAADLRKLGLECELLCLA